MTAATPSTVNKIMTPNLRNNKEPEGKVVRTATNKKSDSETWKSFMKEAKRLSRKKKRQVNNTRKKEQREEEAEKESAIQHWLHLYHKRWSSNEDHEEYCTAPVPPGAWGRVD